MRLVAAFALLAANCAGQDGQRLMTPAQVVRLAEGRVLAERAKKYAEARSWDRSEQEYQQAESLMESAGAADEAAQVDTALGMIYFQQGLYSEARRTYRRAMDSLEQISPRPKRYGSTVAQLADLAQLEGDFDDAMKQARKALEFLAGSDNDTLEYRLRCMTILGTIYMQTDRFDEAEKQFQEVLETRRTRLPETHAQIADQVSLIGQTLVRRGLGWYLEGEKYLLMALAERAHYSGPASEDTASALLDLGDLYQREGNYLTAERFYLAGGEIFAKKNPGHAQALTLPGRHARNLWSMDRMDEAAQELMRENRVLGDSWSKNLLSMDTVGRRNFTRLFDDLLPLSLSLALELADGDHVLAAKLAAAAAGTRKGIRSAATEEFFAEGRRSRNPEAVALLRDLKANASVQSEAASAKSTRGSLIELKNLQREIEQKLIGLMGEGNVVPPALDPDEASAYVPSGAAFIDIVRYSKLEVPGDQFLQRDGSGKTVEKNPQYAALVYRRGERPALIAFGSVAPIDQAVDQIQRMFDNIWERDGPRDVLKSGAAFQSNLNTTNAACAALYRLTMEKLLPVLGGAKRLIVSPDAALAEIPWEIMRTGAGRYLIEDGYKVSYLDSVRGLIERDSETTPRTAAAIIVNVDYNARPEKAAQPESALTSGGEGRPAGAGFASWQPLQGGDEILRAAKAAGAVLGEIRKLQKGSEEEVEALKGPAALIVHTHGFFRGDSAANLEGLESGIILQGANHAGEKDRAGRDGWLMAKELMQVDLEGTRLVAMMGCETGVGVEAGEGVQGMRHAIAVAGAKASLLTLWSVGDLSIARFTRELLARSAAERGKGFEDVLAETKLAFVRGEVREAGATAASNRWRHPYFWGAATLAGRIGGLDFHLGR